MCFQQLSAFPFILESSVKKWSDTLPIREQILFLNLVKEILMFNNECLKTLYNNVVRNGFDI